MFLIDSSYYKIKATKDKGRGVFAKKEIKQKTIIGEYTGTKVKIEEYNLEKDIDGLYLMFLDDTYAIYPDLNTNDLHLINHSCEPNCWILNTDGKVYFFALRDINVGEELTISYLLSPNDGTCNPCTHICKCGSKKCTGTMHLSKSKFLKWQKFQSMLYYKSRMMKYNDLTSEEKRIIEEKGTEAPFTGEYDDFYPPEGFFVCRRCNNTLFSAKSKFDAGCGWPAFDDNFPNAVKRILDSDGRRTEIQCGRCGGHLGHVFEGERMTEKNTRHCVNSLSIKFVPKEIHQ